MRCRQRLRGSSSLGCVRRFCASIGRPWRRPPTDAAYPHHDWRTRQALASPERRLRVDGGVVGRSWRAAGAAVQLLRGGDRSGRCADGDVDEHGLARAVLRGVSEPMVGASLRRGMTLHSQQPGAAANDARPSLSTTRPPVRLARITVLRRVRAPLTRGLGPKPARLHHTTPPAQAVRSGTRSRPVSASGRPGSRSGLSSFRSPSAIAPCQGDIAQTRGQSIAHRP